MDILTLHLPSCTHDENSVAPGVPQNLTTTIGSGQVTLAWHAVTNAASYDLWAWDSVKRKQVNCSF